MLLFRKIDENKWFGKQELETISISDLFNKDNELSVWMGINGATELDLALAFALTGKSIKGVYWVKIPDGEIEAKGLELRQEDSITPFVSLRSNHTNIKVPTLYELGAIAEIIHQQVQEPDTNCKFVSETELNDRFYDAVKEGLIEIDFSDKYHKGKWDTIRMLEKQKGKIDYSQIQTVIPGK
jgi:hypothetical protein